MTGKAICRAPQGARGLKYFTLDAAASHENRRAPQGARGLKCLAIPATSKGLMSRPARGAWIEMIPPLQSDDTTIVAPRKGRVD